MDVVVKQASLTDLDKLMEWRMEVLRDVFSISPSEDTRSLYRSNLEYYQKSIPNGNHIAAFAQSDRITVGCGGVCLYQEMPSPDNPTGQCAYLMNIYTRAKYRGQGAGQAMVRWLVDRAQKQGITKIYLETSRSGRPLYESLGFQDMQDYMKMQ